MPPRYERAASESKLDPLEDEIHRLPRADPKQPGQRVRELIARLGFHGGKTIVDDYLREVRLMAMNHVRASGLHRPAEVEGR